MQTTNINFKKTGVAKLITGKVDFRAKEIVRDKGGHCTKITEPINKEDILLLMCMHQTTELQNT